MIVAGVMSASWQSPIVPSAGGRAEQVGIAVPSGR